MTLVAHDFTDISDYSILKYLVDEEIRGLPIIKEGSNISYRSAPSDGTPYESSSVTLDVDNKEKYYDESIKYFTGLGYVQEDDCKFLQDKENYCYLKRDDYEIIIDQAGNTIRVTKLSPV